MNNDVRSAAIRRWSLGMSFACPALAAIVLGATAVHWLDLDASGVREELHLSTVQLDAGRRSVGLALLLIQPAIMAYGLVRLRAAFAAFARGEVFAAPAIARLRDFAGAAAISAILTVPIMPALSWMLTSDLPGGPQVIVAVGAGQLTILLVAGVVWVFAKILTAGQALAAENHHLQAERRALADENAQFV
jgi:hypothetical protein